MKYSADCPVFLGAGGESTGNTQCPSEPNQKEMMPHSIPAQVQWIRLDLVYYELQVGWDLGKND